MENVPVRNASTTPPDNRARSMAPQPARPERNGDSNRRILSLALIGAIAAVLVLAGWLLYRSSMTAQIDGSRYQAVFFSNGQVYFGKLNKLSGGYLKLTDVYYLQSKTADADDSKNPQETSEEQSTDLQLIKLGGEVHGPDDEMIINTEQILFFENLKPDSQVATSIENYTNK